MVANLSVHTHTHIYILRELITWLKHEGQGKTRSGYPRQSDLHFCRPTTVIMTLGVAEMTTQSVSHSQNLFLLLALLPRGGCLRKEGVEQWTGADSDYTDLNHVTDQTPKRAFGRMVVKEKIRSHKKRVTAD